MKLTPPHREDSRKLPTEGSPRFRIKLGQRQRCFAVVTNACSVTRPRPTSPARRVTAARARHGRKVKTPFALRFRLKLGCATFRCGISFGYFPSLPNQRTYCAASGESVE